MSFNAHPPRPIPIEGEFISLASEVAALLNRHAQKLHIAQQTREREEFKWQRSLGCIAQLVFYLDRALADTREQMASAQLGKVFKRIRIIKDQLKDYLASVGCQWRDPTGEPFTHELAEIVEVDGWRHSDQYRTETVIETREPIVLFNNQVILNGAIVVGAPET